MKIKAPLIVSILFILCSLLFNTCSAKDPIPFAESGPFEFGTKMNITLADETKGKEVNLYIWYPAVLREGEESGKYNFDAEPDTSEAPYPVILLSAKGGTYLGPHLATYGFVVVGVDGQDSQDHLGKWNIDYPWELVFALEQLSSTPLDGFEEMMNTELVGATGYSFGGYNALVLGGARIDPTHFLEKCSSAKPGDPFPESWWIDYECNIEEGWDSIVSYAGPEMTNSEDGLWQPITDPRIKAVAPLVPEGAWLFGKKGLAFVDKPVMILAATEDDINPYNLEAVYIYENLPSPDKIMISFIGQDHMMLLYDETGPIIKHFLVAFFGYHLQGQQDYAEYLSETLIGKFDNLAWGVYDD